MDPNFIYLAGDTLQMLGEVLIGYTAIRVHFRFWKEHSIDEEVFSVMKKEQFLGVMGIFCIVIGFVIRSFIA